MIHQIIIIFIIVGIKGIFSAADTSFTYMNRAEITQLSKKDKKAKKIKILMEDTNKFFGIIEVGINMAELISSAYASMTIVNNLSFLIEKLPVQKEIALFLSSFIITILLAYILLVFGGVIPKKIARNNPKKVAYRLANILWLVAKLNYPFEKVIDISDRFFSRLLHLPEKQQEKMTEKQLKMIITEAKEEGVVANIEKRILFNALKADDIQVKKVMIPEEKVDFININSNFEEVLDNIETYQYTRMPVYEGQRSNVIGIFNIKDIAIQYAKTKTVNQSIHPFLRKVKFVHENEKIFDALKKMQKEHNVMAVVVNDTNQAIGVISVEDIVEKLVGKIFDEYDKQ